MSQFDHKSLSRAINDDEPQAVPRGCKTASLIDVDSTYVNTIESDFLEQDVKTTTQAERLEREAVEAEERRAREAANKKAKARKSKNLGPDSDNPVYIANAVIGTLVGAGLGFGVYRKHTQGKLSWELVGLVPRK